MLVLVLDKALQHDTWIHGLRPTHLFASDVVVIALHLCLKAVALHDWLLLPATALPRLLCCPCLFAYQSRVVTPVRLVRISEITPRLVLLPAAHAR
jgi:hypothetical protein